MTNYDKSITVLSELFGKDYTFVLSTAKNNVPSSRVVDTYYENGVFWVVTYATSRKCVEIASNPNVALCNDFHTFTGKAYNMGHPLKVENKEIRETLTKVFAAWYFAHNNEKDENMCFLKIVPEIGTFHKDGTGYKANFIAKEVVEFPFAPRY